MELEDFLVEAKRSTNGSEETKPVQLGDGSKEYRIEIEESTGKATPSGP